MTIAPTKDLISIGTLASQTRATVRAIEAAAEALGITPAMRLNLVIHFDGNQAEQITSYLDGQRQKVKA